MRLYSIVNHIYLSEKQLGIQTSHITSELSVELKGQDLKDYKTWAKEHKTVIMLGGGFSSNIARIAEVIGQSSYSGVMFHEAEEALNGALTATGLILPERMYILAQYAKQGIVKTVEISDGEEVTGYTLAPADELKISEEDMKNLTAQLEEFGEYTPGDIVLVNELNQLHLA